MKLSVVVITLNEEKNIGRFLKTVADIADEVIIVDSYSTDRTKEIASEHPSVTFISNEFKGYGQQKNFALSKCRGEWILFPDADEVVDEQAKESIKQIIAGKGNADVYLLKFNNILLGKHLRYGGWGSVSRERFFRNGFGEYSDDKVHEKFLTSGRISTLNGRINHYTYHSVSQHIDKINRYSTLMAEKYVSAGKKVGIIKIVFTPWFTFIKDYIFKLGFLDGVIGLYAAVTTSYYAFLKYIKLYLRKKS